MKLWTLFSILTNLLTKLEGPDECIISIKLTTTKYHVKIATGDDKKTQRFVWTGDLGSFA